MTDISLPLERKAVQRGVVLYLTPWQPDAHAAVARVARRIALHTHVSHGNLKCIYMYACMCAGLSIFALISNRKREGWWGGDKSGSRDGSSINRKVKGNKEQDMKLK